MDEIDEKILKELERDARLSNTAIASKLKVSEGTVRKRIQNLVKDGTIKRFTVNRSTKNSFTAFTLIKAKPKEPSEEIVSAIKKISGVKRVLDITGKIDFMAEVVTSSPQEFNEAIDRIRKIPAVESTESLIVLKVN